VEFDDWRRLYRQLSFQDQQAFAVTWKWRFPEQKHFDSVAAARFLDRYRPEQVVEIGGYDGELARIMLQGFPCVLRWRNLELCPRLTPRPDDPRYEHVELAAFPWQVRLDGDALIMSHVAEHMLHEEFATLVGMFNGRYVFVDAPIQDGPQDWTGYFGSHILDTGWEGINETMRTHGFTADHVCSGSHWYSR